MCLLSAVTRSYFECAIVGLLVSPPTASCLPFVFPPSSAPQSEGCCPDSARRQTDRARQAVRSSASPVSTVSPDLSDLQNRLTVVSRRTEARPSDTVSCPEALGQEDGFANSSLFS